MFDLLVRSEWKVRLDWQNRQGLFRLDIQELPNVKTYDFLAPLLLSDIVVSLERHGPFCVR